MVRGRRPVGDEFEVSLGYGVPYSKSLIKKLGLKHEAHQGVDFATTIGAPCVAYRDGFIQIAHDNGDGYGNRIWLYCDVFKEEKPIRVLYAHLKSMSVTVGQRVKEGQILGLTGDTGKVSAPHLHFEVRVLPENTVIEPLFYLRSNRV